MRERTQQEKKRCGREHNSVHSNSRGRNERGGRMEGGRGAAAKRWRGDDTGVRGEGGQRPSRGTHSPPTHPPCRRRRNGGGGSGSGRSLPPATGAGRRGKHLTPRPPPAPPPRLLLLFRADRWHTRAGARRCGGQRAGRATDGGHETGGCRACPPARRGALGSRTNEVARARVHVPNSITLRVRGGSSRVDWIAHQEILCLKRLQPLYIECAIQRDNHVYIHTLWREDIQITNRCPVWPSHSRPPAGAGFAERQSLTIAIDSSTWLFQGQSEQR